MSLSNKIKTILSSADSSKNSKKTESKSESKKSESKKTTESKNANIARIVTAFFITIISQWEECQEITKYCATTKVQKELIKKLNEVTRKVKDKSAPKGARTSYILFCQEKRDDIKNDHPDLSGKEWKKLSDEEQDAYKVKAKVDKDRYDREMKRYKAPTQEELKEKAVKAKTIRDPDAPKKAKTAYNFFMQKNREEEKGNMRIEKRIRVIGE